MSPGSTHCQEVFLESMQLLLNSKWNQVRCCKILRGIRAFKVMFHNFFKCSAKYCESYLSKFGQFRFLLCYFNFPGDRDLVLLLQLVQLGLRKKFFSTTSMSSSSSLGPSCHCPPFTIVENLICNFSLFSCKYTHIIFIGPRSDHSLPMSVTD